jgi:hypothetical protein
MHGAARALDGLNRMAVGCALSMFVGTLATTPVGDALVEWLAFAVANGALGYAIAWAVLR